MAEIFRCTVCRREIPVEACVLPVIPVDGISWREFSGLGFSLTPICLEHPSLEMMRVEVVEHG